MKVRCFWKGGLLIRAEITSSDERISNGWVKMKDIQKARSWRAIKNIVAANSMLIEVYKIFILISKISNIRCYG